MVEACRVPMALRPMPSTPPETASTTTTPTAGRSQRAALPGRMNSWVPSRISTTNRLLLVR
jgi:hypothetical protein